MELAPLEPAADEPSPSQPAPGGGWLRRFGAQGAFTVLAILCLTPLASPAVALAAGMALALLLGNPFRKAGHKTAKMLLQACVVLLGFGMNLGVVLEAGASGALLAVITIAVTLGAGWFLGRWLGLRPMTTALISAGTAICGGSAIAAVGSTLNAEEGDMTVAMGTVFLLNAAGLYLFPIIGHQLGMSPTQFGTWAGVGIHDVSSVVGAASHYGDAALQTATAVKLARALWIVPLTLASTLAVRARLRPQFTNATFGFDASQQSPRKIQIPWFIGLFLLASVVRSMVPQVAVAAGAITHLATVGLTLTLFLIGAGLTRQTLARVGWRALVHGVILWVLISVLSLGLIELI